MSCVDAIIAAWLNTAASFIFLSQICPNVSLRVNVLHTRTTYDPALTTGLLRGYPHKRLADYAHGSCEWNETVGERLPLVFIEKVGLRLHRLDMYADLEWYAEGRNRC